jgi:hypothetical protein
MKKNEALMDKLYTRWCVAEFTANCIYDELGEDFTHPRFLRAERRSRDLLLRYLNQRTRSLRHIVLKLEVACEVEDYVTDVWKLACREVAPHAVVGAMEDLKILAL